jgi:hypothetical protein
MTSGKPSRNWKWSKVSILERERGERERVKKLRGKDIMYNGEES